MDDRDGFGVVIDKINRQRMYRTGEVAALLQCSVRYVQLLVELGRLKALRVGRFIRVPGHALVSFIERHKEWDA